MLIQYSEILGVLGTAIFLGGFAFAVIAKTLPQSNRQVVQRWCYVAGGVSVFILMLFFILHVEPPAKTVIGIVFAGLPALVCGLMLTIQSLMVKVKGRNKL